jgi:phosphonate transport system substrate-binding protein
MKRKVSFVLLAFSFIFFNVSRPLSAGETPFRFAVFPYKSAREMMVLFTPVAKQLEKGIGRQVDLVSASNAKQFNERAVSGEYDLIWPCNTCYLYIHEKAGYEAIAWGTPPFNGAVIVRSDSGINKLSQLKGKKVAAIGKGSYAAFQFFDNKMRDMGLNAPDDYLITFLGKLDAIILSVIARQYDAGVIREDALSGPRFGKMRDKLTIIDRSIAVPQFPFAVKPGIDPALKERITKVLTGISADTQQGKAILKAFKIKRIEVCTDSDFEAFRAKVKTTKW